MAKPFRFVSLAFITRAVDEIQFSEDVGVGKVEEEEVRGSRLILR